MCLAKVRAFVANPVIKPPLPSNAEGGEVMNRLQVTLLREVPLRKPQVGVSKRGGGCRRKVLAPPLISPHILLENIQGSGWSFTAY